jgi:hypothetical protein
MPLPYPLKTPIDRFICSAIRTPLKLLTLPACVREPHKFLRLRHTSLPGTTLKDVRKQTHGRWCGTIKLSTHWNHVSFLSFKNRLTCSLCARQQFLSNTYMSLPRLIQKPICNPPIPSLMAGREPRPKHARDSLMRCCAPWCIAA